MYVTVSWEAIGAASDEIDRDVQHAFGALARCRFLGRSFAVRPVQSSDLSTLVANLDGIEQVHQPDFGYSLFLHTDGDSFRCSESFDVAAARAVTRAV